MKHSRKITPPLVNLRVYTYIKCKHHKNKNVSIILKYTAITLKKIPLCCDKLFSLTHTSFPALPLLHAKSAFTNRMREGCYYDTEL